MARITCTITKAGRTNEFGQSLVLNSTYTGDSEFITSLVAAGFATLADPRVLYAGNRPTFISSTDIAQPTPALLGNTQALYRMSASPFASFRSNGTALVQVPTSGVAVAASTSTDTITATANTAALQAALTIGGYVSVTTPGVYYINATLIVYSNTTVYIGPGVTIKMLDNVSGGIFTNYAARLTAAANPTLVTAIQHGVSGAGITWGSAPDGQNYAIYVTGVPGIGAKYPVGSMVSVVATGHLPAQGSNAQANAGYRGVWKVVESTSTGLKYETRRTYPGSNNPTGTLTIYPADENILIKGPGTIDGNGPNISALTYVSGDPRGNVIWTRHARNVQIAGLTFKRGVTWTIGSNYVRDYTVVNCKGDVRGTSNNDFVHMVGAHQNTVIDNVSGSAGDNMVGLTIDITDDTANGLNWTGSVFTYGFPFQDPGDMWDTTITRIHGNTQDTASFALVGIYGPASYLYHNTTLDNLGGYCGSTVGLANYPQTGMTQVSGDTLRMSNLKSFAAGNQFDVTGAQSWSSIVLDGVVLPQSTLNGAVNFAGTGTIGQFVLKNVSYADTGGRTSAVVTLTTQTVTALNVSDCEAASLGAGIPFMTHTGTGTIGRMSFTNVSGSSTASGLSALLSATGSGAVGSVTFSNCAFTGTTSTGAIFSQGTSSAYGAVTMNGCQVSGAQAAFVGANTTPSINVFLNNLTLATGTACSYAGIFAGPTNLFVNGYTEIQAPTNNPFQTLTAAKAYVINVVNAYTSKTDMIAIAAATLVRGNGTGLKTLAANLASAVQGDVIMDITSGAQRFSVKNTTAGWTALGV